MRPIMKKPPIPTYPSNRGTQIKGNEKKVKSAIMVALIGRWSLYSMAAALLYKRRKDMAERKRKILTIDKIKGNLSGPNNREKGIKKKVANKL
jgi:hypothetical protein